MSRSYKGVFLKKHRVYAVEDLMRLYSVTANTVSNLVGEGLTASDSCKPYLFQGAAVISFHKQRRERLRINLRPGEFKCTGCKTAVFPAIETVRDCKSGSNNFMYFAQCPDCHACISKFPSETDRDNIEICRNPNTTTNHLHELILADSGRIGINEEKIIEKLWLGNDRILFRWMTYAEQYDVKTVDRHLAAIRYCEKVSDGKCFGHFTIEDVSNVRNELKRRANANANDHLSPSTIKHIASHLAAFFEWLLKQDGFKRLPKDLPDYCKLPKATLSSALARKTKEYPSITQAANMLESMPTRSRLEQRARAIFALAFLGALRADTLVSLRIAHIDVPNQRIIRDGGIVRAKNGKSDIIFWFPIPKIFKEVVADWVTFVTDTGFRDDDALFPNSAWLHNGWKINKKGRNPISPMSTTHAVTNAFLVATQNSEIRYTPHAAKHTIGAERDVKQLTNAQRKAWSENMGHESERITQMHYGKFSNDQRAEIIENISERYSGKPTDLSDMEKVALVDEVLARFRNQ